MWLFASTVSSICWSDNSVSLTPLGYHEDDDEDDEDDDDDHEEEDLVFCLWNNCSSSNCLPFGKLHHKFQLVLWSLALL